MEAASFPKYSSSLRVPECIRVSESLTKTVIEDILDTEAIEQLLNRDYVAINDFAGNKKE
jgi:hypothetical protein